MTYRFDKLYADLIADDGTVCIVYIARSRLFGVTYPHAGVELYRADGRRDVLRATHAEDAPSPADRLRFDGPDGPFVYAFDATHGGWAPEAGPAAGLDWSVRFARARVTAGWPGDPSRPRLHGLGYADLVDMRRLPRRFGLRRLDWGRIHWPDGTLVFNAIRLRDGASWHRTACWSPDGFTASDRPFDLVEADGRFHLALPDRRFALKPVRVLHEGPALDPERFPGRLERFAARAAAGSLRETRWVSRVDVSSERSEKTGWALHERVFL